MVTTRQSKALAATTRSKQTVRSNDIPPELRIDGTTALCGQQTKPQPQSGKSYKAGGARWQDVEPDDTIAVPPRRKRKRADDTAPDADQQFLLDAQRQFKRLRASAQKAGRHDVGHILPYLSHIKQPARQRIVRQYPNDRRRRQQRRRDERAEAYVLSPTSARHLLQSNETIDAPVFVTNGANTAEILDPDSTERPISQLLAWFPNPSEQFDGEHTTPDPPTLAEIRQRFLRHNDPVPSPWNLPDMAYPFPHPGQPSFFQSPACNLLRDVVRYLIDTSPDQLCPPACKGYNKTTRQCKKHFLTTTQYGEIQTGWRHWQGTVLLAEAGAITLPHVDKWGLGTWLSCLEGEIGFAWQSHHSEDQLRALQRYSREPEGKWLLKVLRAGDTLYMGPGTPHLVFRLPEGGQTGGIAGNVVRRRDVEGWVRMLLLEVEGEDDRDEGFADVVVSLVDGIGHYLDETEASIGGDRVKRVRKTIEKMRSLLEQL